MPKDTLDFGDVKKLVEAVKSDFEQFQNTVKERDAELLKKNDVDPLIDVKLEKINADLDEKQKVLDELYASTKRKSIFIDGKPVEQDELDEKAYEWAKVAAQGRNGKNMPESFGHDEAKAYDDGFQTFLREGKDGMSPEEVKALSVGSDPDGGYTVSPDTSGRLVSRIFETSPMRQFASVQMISSDSLDGMFDVDEAATGWVSETGTRSETSTPQFDVWNIPVHEQYAEPRATQKLLDDSSINVEQWLANKVSDKMARTENTAFVNGDGIGKPRGFLDYPDYTVAGTFELGAIEQFDTGVNGGFAADPAGGDVLINAIYGIKAAYRQRATWFMNRTTTGAVRLLKDSDGRMLWAPSLAAGQPSTLLGYPVASFEDMPDYTGTGALAMGFGDMAATYQIVDRMGIRVLRDPYTAKPFVKFYTTKRVGGDVVNFEAMKLIAFQA